VPLQTGQNVLSVTATTPDGQTATSAVIVTRNGQAAFTVAVTPASGMVPFTSGVLITNRGNATFQRIELDFNDDGTPELTLSPTTTSTIVQAFTYQNPGNYTLRVTVFDASNNVLYLTRRKIVAIDPVDMTVRATAVYNGMLAQLAQGNVSGALNSITSTMRPKYQAIFNQLGASLPSAVSQLGSIQSITVGSGYM